MKSCKTNLVLLVIAVVMLNGVAQAQIILSQNFDNTGTFAPETRLGDTAIGDSTTSVGKWKASGQPGLGGSLITAAQSYSSSQSLQVARVAGYETGQFIGFVDEGAIRGTVEVSFRAKRAEAGWSEPVQEYEGSAAWLLVGDSAVLDTQFPGEFIGLRIWNDNNVYVIDGGNAVLVKILDQIDTPGWQTPGNWHAYKLVIDATNQVYDVYYSADGTDAGYTQVYNDAHYDLAAIGYNQINCVRAESPYFNVYRGPVWFDDVLMTGEIYSGPSVCGDQGTVYLSLDFNHDCYVNMGDFAVIAAQWLWCTDPASSACDQYWIIN